MHTIQHTSSSNDSSVTPENVNNNSTEGVLNVASQPEIAVDTNSMTPRFSRDSTSTLYSSRSTLQARTNAPQQHRNSLVGFTVDPERMSFFEGTVPASSELDGNGDEASSISFSTTNTLRLEPWSMTEIMENRITFRNITENQPLRRLESKISKNIQKSANIKIEVLEYENKVLRGDILSSAECAKYEGAKNALDHSEAKVISLQQQYFELTGEHFNGDTSESDDDNTVGFNQSPLRRALGF
jgi:hypothetical protein